MKEAEKYLRERYLNHNVKCLDFEGANPCYTINERIPCYVFSDLSVVYKTVNPFNVLEYFYDSHIDKLELNWLGYRLSDLMSDNAKSHMCDIVKSASLVRPRFR